MDEENAYNRAMARDNKRIWTTATGDRIPYSKLGDSHLANIIRQVTNLVESYPGDQVYMGDSEYGEEAVESENRINQELLEKRQATLEALKSEQAKRAK